MNHTFRGTPIVFNESFQEIPERGYLIAQRFAYKRVTCRRRGRLFVYYVLRDGVRLL